MSFDACAVCGHPMVQGYVGLNSVEWECSAQCQHEREEDTCHHHANAQARKATHTADAVKVGIVTPAEARLLDGLQMIYPEDL